MQKRFYLIFALIGLAIDLSANPYQDFTMAKIKIVTCFSILIFMLAVYPTNRYHQ